MIQCVHVGERLVHAGIVANWLNIPEPWDYEALLRHLNAGFGALVDGQFVSNEEELKRVFEVETQR